MKILHTTDLHFNKNWFTWIASQQNNYDVFCITGDFLESSKDETLLEQIEWITNWMKSFQKPLFVCSGNHDIEELENENWLNQIPNVYSDNSIKTINGVNFGCVPYIAPDFFEFDKCDILLYHLPPAQSKTAIHSETNADWGDKEVARLLQKKILKPKVLLCGHMHYPLDKIDKIGNTTVYNTGADKNNAIPNHHIIKI
ncbi:metallophosphoesterase [Sulfurimonas sp.]|uniref:metallophosphoesterase family protein n=1 Tax=Sulfurimonas sp. TaxID=2022749 RepID=UPI0025FCE26E|nr:metallophosphoesterase [Sulfurimonas sp.]